MKTITPKKVDICICVKNRGLIIESIVNNLSKQTFKDFNIIICDGMSEDATPLKLIELSNNADNIRIVQTGKDGTYVDAHNLVLQSTVSDYICWLDSDDLVTPNKLEEQVKFLDENTDVDIVTTGVVFTMNEKTVAMPNSLISWTNDEIAKLVEDGNSLSDICHFQTAMFRRECLKEFTNGKYFYDEYNEGRCGEGFLLTLFYLGHKFATIGDVMYMHNLDFAGMTAATDGKETFADEINMKTPGRRKQAIMKLFNKYNKE